MKGCFTFLGEEAKLSWIDATLACEQVISLGEPLNLGVKVQLIRSCISLKLGSNVQGGIAGK